MTWYWATKNIIEWLIIMYGNQKNMLISPSLPPEILGIIMKKTNSFQII